MDVHSIVKDIIVAVVNNPNFFISIVQAPLLLINMFLLHYKGL
jgi:hypothetical protein